MGYIRRRSGM